MEANSKTVLKLMADGNKLSQTLISGAAVIIYDYSNQKFESVGHKVVCELRDAGYIKHKGYMRQGHPIFHGRVDFYVITEKGRLAEAMPEEQE